MRKPAFSKRENKGSDQLPSTRAADQRLCFHYTFVCYTDTVKLHNIAIYSNKLCYKGNCVIKRAFTMEILAWPCYIETYVIVRCVIVRLNCSIISIC